MNSISLNLLMAAPDGAAAGGAGSFVTTLIPFALIIAIFYFFIIRPQNKKQKETKRMLDAIKKGDKVVTIGGLHGVVQSVKESTVIIKVDENTKLEFTRASISSVIVEDKGDKDKIEDKKSGNAGEKGGEDPKESKD
jgi:preprotein translocase subunit YajC